MINELLLYFSLPVTNWEIDVWIQGQIIISNFNVCCPAFFQFLSGCL